jgi:uncharacterized protein YecT (DUF1311 family)
MPTVAIMQVMNTRTTILVAFIVVLPLAFSSGQSTSRTAEQPCWNTSKTQAELNACAATDAQDADAELNRVYASLMEKLRNDPIALESLKQSQRQWIGYRDAQLKAFHPHTGKEGSAHSMCISLEVAEITSQRIKILQAMLHPSEGDVCAH